MKLIRNILISILFLWFYGLFIKSYFFDRFLFESIIYIFGLYVTGHLFFIFYKADKYLVIWLLLMSMIVSLLSKSFDYSSILQILLFHAAIRWMSRDMDFVINGRINVNRRSLMMYSSTTFIILISVVYAIRIWTVPNNFSCDVLRNQTNDAVNYVTLTYPRNKANERFDNSSLNNIINGKMSNILWISFSDSGDATVTWNINKEYVNISDWLTWANISDLNTNQLKNINTIKNSTETENKEVTNNNDILLNLTTSKDASTTNANNNDILWNLTHNAPSISTWYIADMPEWIIGKLEYLKSTIIDNLIKDKSIADKWICEYIYEQVKVRQNHPEFLISSVILLFAILYPFFRFLFYIVWFLGRLVLLLLCKLWLYKINIYYEKIEKIE